MCGISDGKVSISKLIECFKSIWQLLQAGTMLVAIKNVFNSIGSWIPAIVVLPGLLAVEDLLEAWSGPG